MRLTPLDDFSIWQSSNSDSMIVYFAEAAYSSRDLWRCYVLANKITSFSSRFAAALFRSVIHPFIIYPLNLSLCMI